MGRCDALKDITVVYFLLWCLVETALLLARVQATLHYTPDVDVFLKQQHKLYLDLLHSWPVLQVQHVGREEDDQAQEDHLCWILWS